MASVRLDFVRPSEPGLTKLHIYESDVKAGPYSEIEEVTAIGAYPNYISYYTTTLATGVDKWFEIEWEDAQGALTPRSIPVQGGTTSVVAQLVNRMLLRDPSLDENIAAQEAEAAISNYYNVDDPYTIDPATVSPAKLSGLTMLALARAYIVQMLTTSNTSSYTAGLVQQTTGTITKQQGSIEALIKLANSMLGINYSFIALLEETEIAGGFKKLVAADVSRGIIEIG